MRNISRLISGLLVAALAVLPLAAPAQQPGQPSQPVVVSTSGTITTSGGGPTIFGLTGQSVCTIDIPASSSFTGTLTVQGSTGWETLPVVPFGSTTTQTSITAIGLYNVVTPALSQIRVIGPTSTGSAAVYVQCTYLPGVVSVVPAPVVIASPLPLPVSISSPLPLPITAPSAIPVNISSPLPLPIAPPLTGVSGTGTAQAANQAVATSCAFNSALPTITSGNVGPNQCDTAGRQIVVGAGTAGTATGGVVTVQGIASGTTVPVLCTAANCPVNIANVAGSAVTTSLGIPSQQLYPANTTGGGCQGVNLTTGTQITKQVADVALTSATNTPLVALVASKFIHVCGFTMSAVNLTATVFTLGFGLATGAACAGYSPIYSMNVPSTGNEVIAIGDGGASLFDIPSGDALCVSAPTFSVGAIITAVTYAQY